MKLKVKESTASRNAPALERIQALGPVPRTAHQALSGAEAPQWLGAMETELARLSDVKVWKPVAQSFSEEALRTKWVYQRYAHNAQVAYRARVVVVGSEQPSIDAPDVPPNGGLENLRFVLAHAVHHRLEITHFRTDESGLHIALPLAEQVLISPPTGSAFDHHTLRVLKTLPGMKQAYAMARAAVDATLQRAGLKRMQADPSLFHSPNGSLAAFGVAYNGGMVLASSQAFASELLSRLAASGFPCSRAPSDLILGLTVYYDKPDSTVYLGQPEYIDRLLARFPELVGNTREDRLTHKRRFHELRGCIQWLAGSTRPDLNRIARRMTQYASLPAVPDEAWELAVEAFAELGVSQDLYLGLQCDADDPPLWASTRPSIDTLDGKDARTLSTFVQYHGATIGWRLARDRQSRSDAEAAIVARGESVKEIVGWRNVLEEAGVILDGAAEVEEPDAAPQASTSWRKAIEVQDKYAQEHIDAGHVHIVPPLPEDERGHTVCLCCCALVPLELELKT